MAVATTVNEHDRRRSWRTAGVRSLPSSPVTTAARTGQATRRRRCRPGSLRSRVPSLWTYPAYPYTGPAVARRTFRVVVGFLITFFFFFRKFSTIRNFRQQTHVFEHTGIFGFFFVLEISHFYTVIVCALAGKIFITKNETKFSKNVSHAVRGARAVATIIIIVSSLLAGKHLFIYETTLKTRTHSEIPTMISFCCCYCSKLVEIRL